MLDYIKNLFPLAKNSENSSLFCDSIKSDFDVDLSTNCELVLESSCVNRCLSLIVNAISNLQVQVFKDGIEDSSCLVSLILQNPSDTLCYAEFIDAFIWNYLVYGNSYIVLSKVQEQKFELFNLNSAYVSILLDKKTKSKIEGYAYALPGNDALFFLKDANFPYVGHFKNFNPKNNWYGYSLLDPVRKSAMLSQKIDQHNLAVISNGGRPAGILSISPNKVLTEEQKDDYVKKFKEKHYGPGKVGEIMLLNGDCQWQPFNANTKDMDYSDAARRSLRAIATGLGIPPELSGDSAITGESSKANMEVSYKIFYKSTVMPLANKISQFLSVFFSKSFNENISIKLVDNDSFNNK